MDKTVPKGAALLLDFIYRTETSSEAPACYEVIYGNRQSALDKPLTRMTLAEVQAAQLVWASKAWAAKFGSGKASSAAGAPQLMRATLQGLMADPKLGLSPTQVLDADLQDRLGYHLLERRGYQEFMDGTISRTEFGKRLAQEWASFPVLAATKGQKRTLERGQSYYAGDGLNKALVAPVRVEAILDQVKEAGRPVAAPIVPPGEPIPIPAAPAPAAQPGAVARFVAAFRRAFGL